MAGMVQQNSSVVVDLVAHCGAGRTTTIHATVYEDRARRPLAEFSARPWAARMSYSIPMAWTGVRDNVDVGHPSGRTPHGDMSRYVNVEDVIVADRLDAVLPLAELPLGEHRQAGRLARARIPRSSQADWVPPDDRLDPVAFVREADRGRVADLLPVRYARMAASPF